MEKFVYRKLVKHEKQDWWNRSLREIVSSYINSYSPVKYGRLLDVGFGTGIFLEQLSGRWETYGVDISKTAMQMAKRRGLKNVQLARAEDLPFSDNFFDVVLALDVLEHLEDEAPALEEIRRALKPGGIAIINSPAYQLLWSYHDETAKHYRRYTKGSLRKKLEGVGFNILKLTYINFFLFPLVVLYRLPAKLIKPKKRSDVGVVPKFLQSFFYKIFSSERYLLKFTNFPFGLSISAIVTKR